MRSSFVMRRAIYPGSFDPITLGHMDVIERARAIFPELIVAVANNEVKNPLFTLEERMQMIREALAGYDNVRVEKIDGLLVDFAVRHEVSVLVRGLRAVSDFEYEFQMALMNRRLQRGIETIFLTPSEECTFLSSRIVKEVARLGGDVSGFVPASVVSRLQSKFDRRS